MHISMQILLRHTSSLFNYAHLIESRNHFIESRNIHFHINNYKEHFERCSLRQLFVLFTWEWSVSLIAKHFTN